MLIHVLFVMMGVSRDGLERDGKDSDGKPVPFGEYTARVKLPWTIHYRIEGKDEALQQEVRHTIFTQCYFTIGAP